MMGCHNDDMNVRLLVEYVSGLEALARWAAHVYGLNAL